MCAWRRPLAPQSYKLAARGGTTAVEAARIAFYLRVMIDDGSERQRPGFWKGVQQAAGRLQFLELAVLVVVLVVGAMAARFASR